MHWSSHLKCTLRAQCIFGPVKFELHVFGEHIQNISWIAYFTENQDKANRARDSVLICKQKQTPNWIKRQQTHCSLKKLKMSFWKFNDIRPSMVLQCSIVAGKSCKKSHGIITAMCHFKRHGEFVASLLSYSGKLDWKSGFSKLCNSRSKTQLMAESPKKMFVPPSTLKNSGSIEHCWTDFFYKKS